MSAYELVHVVGFEETNLVGNVYFVNFIKWQGRCREMFLHDHAPGLLEMLRGELALITTHCQCDFLAEIQPFDTLRIKMKFGGLSQNRLRIKFEYWRETPGPRMLAGRGEQGIACMKRTPKGLQPETFPRLFTDALKPFMA